jgi:hypothetical protein
MSDWYVSDQGDQKGPFSDPFVVDFLRTRDAARVHVWRQGMENWVLAQDVAELMHALHPPPPPPPPPIPASPPPVVAEASEVPVDRSAAPNEAPVAGSRLRWVIVGALIVAAIAFFQIRTSENRVWLESPDAHAVAYLVGYLGGAALLGAFIGFGCARLARHRGERANRRPLHGRPNRFRSLTRRRDPTRRGTTSCGATGVASFPSGCPIGFSASSATS